MVATEYVLVDSNSIQLLYIGPATLTRTATTAPSRGTLCVTFYKFILVKMTRNTLAILFLSLLLACKSSKRNAYFFLSNTSETKKAVDIKVVIGNTNVFDDTIKYTNIAPDLQYTPHVKLPEGEYILRVIADNSKVTTEQTINLDNDRWIFVSYSYIPPIDTAEVNNRSKNFGYDTSWINQQLRGVPPAVKVHIMNKEPVHM